MREFINREHLDKYNMIYFPMNVSIHYHNSYYPPYERIKYRPITIVCFKHKLSLMWRFCNIMPFTVQILYQHMFAMASEGWQMWHQTPFIKPPILGYRSCIHCIKPLTTPSKKCYFMSLCNLWQLGVLCKQFYQTFSSNI